MPASTSPIQAPSQRPLGFAIVGLGQLTVEEIM